MSMPALAVHGHFYQPPRDDPATGALPVEPSAAPFSNWNERITEECYRPNAELGNFERLSFDVGPTLLRWLERSAPESYRQILAADRAHLRAHGCGNALAQAYHHVILPLASRADQELEIAWGIADFEHRFGRRPKGLWLPETAADPETLAVLAEQGIELTILAPWQVADEAAEVTVPHWVSLPHGRRLAVFLFHRALSGRLSFDPKATSNADRFARDLLVPAMADEGEGRILLLASDGELYGHHQPYRDLFLSRLLERSAPDHGFEPTVPERWLAGHPPTTEVELAGAGSWSCHHGVARWREGCACTKGDVHWKAPLRRAFDRLASRLDRLYEATAETVVEDPWALRLRYVEVLLGRATADELIADEARATPSPRQLRQLAELLEAQRQRLRMFTSCGWFNGAFDRLETVNNLTFSAAAVDLAQRATGAELAPALRDDLRRLPAAEAALAVGLLDSTLDRLALAAAAPPGGRARKAGARS